MATLSLDELLVVQSALAYAKPLMPHYAESVQRHREARDIIDAAVEADRDRADASA